MKLPLIIHLGVDGKPNLLTDHPQLENQASIDNDTQNSINNDTKSEINKNPNKIQRG